MSGYPQNGGGDHAPAHPGYPMGEVQQQQQIGWQAEGAGPAPPPAQSKMPPPSAPPLDAFGNLPGYEGTSFDGGFAPAPPPYEPPSDDGEGQKVDFQQSELSDAEVRSCLSQYVSENCCYGKGPIEDMKILNVVPTSAFKYTLDTFTEKREAKWKYEASNGPEAPPLGLPVPGPWEVPVAPPTMFKDDKTTVEVPNSSTTMRCHNCQGHGDVRCDDCHGRGYETCSSCSGTGVRIGDEPCTWCDGTGSRQCTWCRGSGMRECNTCHGRHYLRCYVELEVKWHKHDDTFVVEKTALPDNLIKSASGQVAFKDERPRVAPVIGFLDDQIGKASQDLVQKHSTKWPNEHIIMQRHKVQIVPVHTIEYTLGGNESAFHIYGDDNKVHFPDYPSKCCGCCVIC